MTRLPLFLRAEAGGRRPPSGPQSSHLYSEASARGSPTCSSLSIWFRAVQPVPGAGVGSAPGQARLQAGMRCPG